MNTQRVTFILAILALCSAIPASADTAYMLASTETFGTVNLNTGVFTLLGSTDEGITPVLVSGLGEVGGALYSVSFGGDTLYQVDPTDGALSSIGTSGINYFELGSTLTTLYAIDSSGDLDSVNPSTGAATLIGSTGLSLGGDWTLSSNSSTLYFTDFAGGAENLYTLNTTTGLAILIGPTGGPEYGGLMWDGISVLYGGEVLPGQTVDTLNTSTGLATVGPSLTGTGDFYGLAPLLAAPEPATWSLLGAGIAILALMKRRRQRARLTCGTSN